ncbi:MAG TPA: hypothetical protein VGC37_18170 [Friedmanniella sp.]
MTTRILAGSTTERTLAVAATRAGLLDVASAEVVVANADDVEAVAAGLGHDDVELVVGTGAVRTGRALTRRWRDAPVLLVAAGAAAYGPTPAALEGRLTRRADRVLHPALVPGLRPLLLAERSVPTRAVPLEDVRTVSAALALEGGVPTALADPTTLVLGRSADWAGALDRDQQTDLVTAMVQRCAEAGHSRIVLLLDTEPSERTRRHLERTARDARADVALVVDDGPLDGWFARDGVGLVVGCASEDLLVARQVHRRRVAQLDTEVVLRRLAPYADPRRTGATLVEATVPDLRTWTASPEGEELEAVDLAGLMGTVGYAMAPELLAGRRASAIGFLETHPRTRRRFVRRRRLTELRLPGGKRSVRTVLG